MMKIMNILTPSCLSGLSLSLSLGLSLSLSLGLFLGGCDDQEPQTDPQTPDQALDQGALDASVGGVESEGAPWPNDTLTLNNETQQALSGRCLALTLSFGDDYRPHELGALAWRASDLGAYLLLNTEARYLTFSVSSDEQPTAHLAWTDEALPGVWGEEGKSRSAWSLEPHPDHPTRWALKSVGADRLITLGDLLTPDPPLIDGGRERSNSEVLAVVLSPAEGCAEHSELSLDAEGSVEVTTQASVDINVEPPEAEELFGVVDAHAHLFANLGFGPGVHGAPFHPLGVTHALESCEGTHGPEGRRDLWGYFSDQGAEEASLQGLITTLGAGQTPEPNHATDGYPTFSAWPNAPSSATHQTMYYRWLERAWLGGLRLMVLHAVGNEVICELQRNLHPTPELYECNEMEGVRRTIEAAHALERYVDGLAGGEGRGFFRLVKSPSEAREVIKAGKLAVLLGIETSNLFDCYVNGRGGRPTCGEEELDEAFEEAYELGVRVFFPVHKLDNGFSAGDGHRGVIELANFVNSGHYNSFVSDCPTGTPRRFDSGPITFGGLNDPREDYAAPPLLNLEGYGEAPIRTLTPFLGALTEGPLEGDWCQKHGLTPLGERLLEKMMSRGMLIELDHFPTRAYASAFELLERYAYPGALGTHGETFGGRLYELGGLSKVNLGRCVEASDPRAATRQLDRHLGELEAAGRYPSVGFAFDLNGFAGYPRPRFGEQSPCAEPQGERLAYPFSSYAGDVTFTPPQLGAREVDFNEEGLTHVGLLPELIEDAQLMGASRDDLAPLFRSAEAYLRVWEAALERSEALEF